MSNARRFKVVVDTDLIISAILIPQSLPERLLKSFLKDSFDILISQEQLDEIQDVSKKEKLRNYPLFSSKIAELIENLVFAAVFVKPLDEANLPLHSRDPKDDYLLAVSIGGRADYLVTGDEDLLALGKSPGLGKLKIVSARQFLSSIVL